MKVALVGNQNSGKTTLFNQLTGLNQKIGNWPGVTIERKTGIIKGTEDELIDLPGIYSLSPYSSEEEISRNFVLNETPDMIVNIIDATSIERSLYLTTQLLELDTKVVIALNMLDILEKKGIFIDVEKLSEKLGVTVISISALKKTGIEDLLTVIKDKNVIQNRHNKIFEPRVEKEIDNISKTISLGHKRFTSVKLLEGDALLVKQTNEQVKSSIIILEDHYNMDLEQVIANQRYNYITDIKSSGTVIMNIDIITDKLDKVFLNKWAALPIFAVIMTLIYMLAVGVIGGATVELVAGLFDSIAGGLSDTLTNAGASQWAVSLLCDGIIGGVGAVLGFVPQLIILFICIVILETTGYMSRIAFMLDMLFRKFGLSGKALIPFIVGSGCSVPGIMTTRTIENQNERKMSIVLTPFIPCSAKLPIIALFAGAFFPNSAGLVSASLYFFAIAVILFSAVLLKKFIFKGKSSTFISELPEYKIPGIKYVLKDVYEKTMEFIKRAGSIILLTSIFIWLLLSFNWRFEYGVDVNESILASIGNAISWIFYPMLGELSWAASVSAIQGLVAKEGVVSSMEVIAGVAEGAGSVLFNSQIFSFFSGTSAYAFMVFNLFSAPCFGAIAAMRRELGSNKKMFKAIGFQTLLALLLSYLVFGIGSLIGVIF